MLSYHIRRITGNYVKRSPAKNGRSFFHISCYNPNFFFQMIVRNTSPGHISTHFLYLQASKVSTFCFCSQQNRYDSCPAAHIQHFFFRPYSCKTRQQNCVHSKTKLLRVLYQTISILKIVQAFSFQQYISHSNLDFPPSSSRAFSSLSSCSVSFTFFLRGRNFNSSALYSRISFSSLISTTTFTC